MAAGARHRPRVSLWVVALLFAALALGASAALLTAPVAPNPPTYVYPPFDITVTEAGWLIIAFVVVWLVAHLVERQRQGSALIPSRAISVALLAILLAVAFVLIARFAGPGGLGPSGTPDAGGGSTPPTASLNNSSNLSVSPGAFAPFHVGGWTIPGWVLFVALLAVAGVVGLVALPIYLSARHAHLAPRAPLGPEVARRDFSDALSRLEAEGDGNVRAVIIGLYARLLLRIAPVLGDLDAHAPREIERACVTTLHIAPDTARALTRLFEEARYSSHPLDAATGARARTTFRQAVADLDAAGWRAA